MNEPFAALFDETDVKGCCAALYETRAVRWLLDGQLHPGGRPLTLRACELAGIGAGDSVLDVASGAGQSAMLIADRFHAEVTGVDLGAAAVDQANAEAARRGLGARVRFAAADAEALPFAAAAFDAVLCECALCTFPDKRRAVGEIARVLRPGGTVAIADVTAVRDALPAELRTFAARVACVADALPPEGYEQLLAREGLELIARESHADALAATVDRIGARLRVARMLKVPALERFSDDIEAAIALARAADEAIAHGHLGYALMVARRGR